MGERTGERKGENGTRKRINKENEFTIGNESRNCKECLHLNMYEAFDFIKREFTTKLSHISITQNVYC